MRPFRLHTVLNYRKSLENRARERLTRAREEAEQLRQEINQRESLLQQICREFEAKKGQGTDVGQIMVYRNHQLRLRNEIAGIRRDLQAAEDRAARRERELIRASRDRKLLEKLKERQDQRYVQYLEEKEKKELDEIAVLYYGRKKI